MTKNLILFFLFALAACGGKTNKEAIFVKNGYAINGYDVVAYFTDSKPVKGDEKLSYEWNNATWIFSSAANLEAFKTDPERYSPQYGGFCAYGCSEGHKAPTEPDAWTIVDGKLYLNYNVEVRGLWRENTDAFIKQANKNWPKVMNE